MIELSNELDRLAKVIETAGGDPGRPQDGRQSHNANKWLKEICPDGPKIIRQADEFLWDCWEIKNEISRCQQSFAQIQRPDFRETLIVDLRTLAGTARAPNRISRVGVRFSSAGAKEELEKILIEYTSGGGMAASGHIDKAKRLLKRWEKKNHHPLSKFLIEQDADISAAQAWLKELETESEPADHRNIRNSVVFVDVVSYSKNTVERQLAIVGELTEIVKRSITSAAISDIDSIALPTGDGMALCLIDQLPDRTAELAVAIMEAVQRSRNGFQIKMGLHFAHDATYIDINGRVNVAGAGINLAARVMDKAGPGQIILSTTMYGELHARETYRDKLEPFKSVALKNVGTHQLYRLKYAGEPACPLDNSEPNEPAPLKIGESLQKIFEVLRTDLQGFGNLWQNSEPCSIWSVLREYNNASNSDDNKANASMLVALVNTEWFNDIVPLIDIASKTGSLAEWSDMVCKLNEFSRRAKYHLARIVGTEADGTARIAFTKAFDESMRQISQDLHQAKLNGFNFSWTAGVSWR